MCLQFFGKLTYYIVILIYILQTIDFVTVLCVQFLYGIVFLVLNHNENGKNIFLLYLTKMVFKFEYQTQSLDYNTKISCHKFM